MMSGEKRIRLLDTIQTFWPVFLFAFGLAVWAVKSQTVSTTSFNGLKTRVVVIEERIPTRGTMMKIRQNQAIMQSQLKNLSKNIDNVLKLVHKGP